MQTWKKVAVPLALAFTLAGCGESPQDIAAKPAIVQQIVDNSMSICQTGPVNADKSFYAQRLNNVLMDASTANLQTLKDHNVTVCLDQRLSQQQTGFWTSSMDGVYYGQKDGGVVSLWDNGKQPEQVGFWDGMSTYYRGYDAVNGIANKVRDGEQAPNGGHMAAYEYGKSHSISWSMQDANKGSLKENPQLQTPPLKAPQPKPAS